MAYIEIAPSNRSKCGWRNCKKIIKKGDKRLVVADGFGSYSSKYYICKNCINKYLANEKKECLKDIRIIKKNLKGRK